jgi:predicted regulator of Ras-like GTPase activity (Roadblock/LC7/MglB family)
MRQILTELNQEVGIKGSMVVTPDGIVAEAVLGPTQSRDLVAAIVSSTVISVKNALVKLGTDLPADQAGTFAKFILESSFGKMVFVDAGIAYLVVILDKGINLDVTMIAISAAAHRIKMTGKIRI